jgi:hypothetical protein
MPNNMQNIMMQQNLSVLKSHFNLTCIGLFKQLYCLCERRFVRTFDLQKGFSLSEAVNEGSGKEMVWVQKIWRAFAIRAKAHRLDQNQQSLADKAQRSDH